MTKGGARFACSITTIGVSTHFLSLTKNKCILKLLVRSVDPNKCSETFLNGKPKIVARYIQPRLLRLNIITDFLPYLNCLFLYFG